MLCKQALQPHCLPSGAWHDDTAAPCTTAQVVSQRAMADITGAAVRALALSAFAKVVRRQQPAGSVSGGAAAEAGSGSVQEVCDAS